jgi:Fe-S cluster assembly protein SufD
MTAPDLSAGLLGHHDDLAGLLPGEDLPWLSNLREQAFDRLHNRGLPTVKHEEWRYTDLRKLQQYMFSVPNSPDTDNPSTLLDNAELSPSAGYRMVFVNGVLSDSLTIAPTPPAGITLGSLATELGSRQALLEKHLGAALPSEPHGFTCANSAYFRDGAMIIIGEGCELDAPVELVFITSSDTPVVAHPRNLILCGRDSRTTVIERHISGMGQPCLNNPITEIFTADGASLDHYKIQAEQEKGFHTGGIFIQQERSSHVTSNNIGLGSMLARTDLICALNGPGAHLDMNGLAIGNARQHFDNCTEVLHAAPSCTSDEFYKSVLDDRSRSVFRGRIIVAEDAQQTNAGQQSKNLLLSSLSEADIKPQLEIYADDVKCSHGATVGQLDQNSIFYLRSRGISESSARNLLTFAFANEVIERVPLLEIRNQLSQHLAGRLLPDIDVEGLA